MNATTVTLSLAAAEDLARRALAAAGAAPAQAEPTARALVAAEAAGQGGHGLSRVPSYAAQLRTAKVRGDAAPRLAQAAPALLRVDAGHGFFYPAFDLAMPELAARARAQGIAAAAIHRSHHFGVAGQHCERLAEAGLVAFVFGNAPKALAAWGGAAPMLGTNPIAFAAPVPGAAPLVIDLALSTVARGKILAAREVGGTIPEGWAVGPDGRATTDPAEALKGAMLPAGGSKGAALALMVEVMAACVAGAALSTEASSLFDGDGPPPDLGQSVVALDPERLSGGAFGPRIAALLAQYEDAPGVRVPGARRLAARARAEAEGLALDARLVDRIEREMAT